jgi:hypothetical protein
MIVPNVQMGFSPIDGQDGLIRQPFLLLLIKGHWFVAKHLGPLVLLHVGPNQNQNKKSNVKGFTGLGFETL